MQFSRQDTKVFIKLKLRKIHIFILQYSFIQLLLIYQEKIHVYSSTDRLHRIYASEQKQYTIALRFHGGILFMPQFTKKCQHIYQFIRPPPIMWLIHFDSLSIRRPKKLSQHDGIKCDMTLVVNRQTPPPQNPVKISCMQSRT